jgi:hypothetical protein
MIVGSARCGASIYLRGLSHCSPFRLLLLLPFSFLPNLPALKRRTEQARERKGEIAMEKLSPLYSLCGNPH